MLMMLTHHSAHGKLKLFHLEDGGFNHQRDYKIASDMGKTETDVKTIISNVETATVLGTGSSGHEQRGSKPVASEAKPLSILLLRNIIIEPLPKSIRGFVRTGEADVHRHQKCSLSCVLEKI